MGAYLYLPRIDTRAVAEIVDSYIERAVLPRFATGDFADRTQFGVHLALLDMGRGFSFDDCFLYMGGYNMADPAQGVDERYMNIAVNKCESAWRTGKSMRELTYLNPLALTMSDTPYSGGVALYGIAGGVSGLRDQDDEALTVQLIMEVWRHAVTEHQAILKMGFDFIPSPEELELRRRELNESPELPGDH